MAWVQLELQGQAPTARKGAAIAGGASTRFPGQAMNSLLRMRKPYMPKHALPSGQPHDVHASIVWLGADALSNEGQFVVNPLCSQGELTVNSVQSSCGQLPAGDGRADIRGGLVQVQNGDLPQRRGQCGLQCWSAVAAAACPGRHPTATRVPHCVACLRGQAPPVGRCVQCLTREFSNQKFCGQ